MQFFFPGSNAQPGTGGGNAAGTGYNPGGMWTDPQSNAAAIAARNAIEQQKLANQGRIAEQQLANQGRANEAAIQANASALPAWFQQDRFNRIFPTLTSQFNQNFDRVGGTPKPQPEITVGGVYSPQQIQEQVNAGVAANDQATQTAQKQTQQKMAGMGYGSQSPLLMALQQQAQMAGNAGNADIRRQVPFEAAQANATQLLNSQQARQNQWAQFEDSDIRRRQAAQQSQNALLSALAGLV